MKKIMTACFVLVLSNFTFASSEIFKCEILGPSVRADQVSASILFEKGQDKDVALTLVSKDGAFEMKANLNEIGGNLTTFEFKNLIFGQSDFSTSFPMLRADQQVNFNFGSNSYMISCRRDSVK